MLERIRKWLALRRYQTDLGCFLVRRYGRERCYTPAQVLTTIRVHELSARYAAYACAMFCSKAAYATFAASVSAQAFPHLASSFPLPLPQFVGDWPEHHDAIAELCHSYGLANDSSPRFIFTSHSLTACGGGLDGGGGYSSGGHGGGDSGGGGSGGHGGAF